MVPQYKDSIMSYFDYTDGKAEFHLQIIYDLKPNIYQVTGNSIPCMACFGPEKSFTKAQKASSSFMYIRSKAVIWLIP